MLIKKWVLKDIDNRSLFFHNEMKKNVLKSLIAGNIYDYYCKVYFSKLLWKMGKSCSASSYRRSCVFSYKARSVFRRFKLTRHLCKKYASQGLIVGMRKSSF